MKKALTLLAAALIMASFASCYSNKNDNPVYSVQPAETIEDLNGVS